jgi:hypothetical protein
MPMSHLFIVARICFGMIECLPGCDFLLDNCLMRQLSTFTRAQVAGMRDRTASRNHSPGRDQFRREHARHRARGLKRRHADRVRRLHPPEASAIEPPREDGPQDPPPSQKSTGHGRRRDRPVPTQRRRAPAPVLPDQLTSVVADVRHPGQGSSRGGSVPGSEPAGTSVESTIPLPHEDPRSSKGNDRRRHGIGIRRHSRRPASSQPISIELQMNARVSAIPNTKPDDRTRFILSGRPP